jgi:TonB family protein
MKVFFAILVVVSMALAQEVTLQSRPLQEVQIVSLLLNEVSSHRVGILISERGIAFDPSREYVGLLKRARAGEDVVLGLATAKRTTGETPKREGPFSRDQILDILLSGERQGDLASRVKACGLGFEPTDDLIEVYRFAGADEALLSALGNTALDDTQSDRSGSPRRVRLDSEVASGKILFRPKMEYPPLAKMARVQGIVRLKAVINKDGTIQDLRVLDGHPLLVKAALESVAEWRYQPSLVQGKPVEVVTTIEVNFRLHP